MNALNNENFTLADKLRNENPEQFYTLVRMHLSFVLDLNTDEYVKLMIFLNLFYKTF